MKPSDMESKIPVDSYNDTIHVEMKTAKNKKEISPSNSGTQNDVIVPNSEVEVQTPLNDNANVDEDKVKRGKTRIFSILCCLCACTTCSMLSTGEINYSEIGGHVFRMLGSFLYSTDVVTDLLTGISFIGGQTIDQTKLGGQNYSYTKDVCAHFVDYSHPIWGFLVISISWAPGVILLPPLVSLWYSRSQSEKKLTQFGAHVESYWKTVSITILLICIWPLTGIIM